MNFITAFQHDGETVRLFLRRQREEWFPGEEREDDREERRGLGVPEDPFGKIAAVEILPGPENRNGAGAAEDPLALPGAGVLGLVGRERFVLLF